MARKVKVVKEVADVSGDQIDAFLRISLGEVIDFLGDSHGS